MLGKKILELRKKKCLTQEQLGEKLDVTRQTISNWELGETLPNPDQLKLLSSTLKVSVDELLDNEIKNVIEEKVNQTVNNSTMILKILKALGTTIGILLFLFLVTIISIIFFSNYFQATPAGNYAITECKYNGNEFLIEIYQDFINDTISLTTSNQEINDKFNSNNYNDANKMLEDIVVYIENRGGTCGDEPIMSEE